MVSPVCARADADRLTTAGDVAERRRTRGPRTERMEFGDTAAWPMRHHGCRVWPGLIVGVVVLWFAG